MKFGLHLMLPNVPGMSDAETFHATLATASLGDKLGFHSLWCPESSFTKHWPTGSAPEVLLAAVSQRTLRTRLGVIVRMQPKINHPARVAARLATLDLMSHGRVDWVVGEPLSRAEKNAYGFAPDQDGDASWTAATHECAKMLSQEPYLGVSGVSFAMEARNLVPKPSQKPHPPLWRSCASIEDVTRAGHAGVGAYIEVFLSPDEAAVWTNAYRTAMETSCTPLARRVTASIALLCPLLCHPDAEVAKRIGQEIVESRAEGRPSGWTAPTQDGFASHAAIEPLVERLAAYQASGVDQIVFLAPAQSKFGEPSSTLGLFSEFAMPRFIESAPTQEPPAWLLALEDRLAASIEDDDTAHVPVVEAYPLLSERLGVDSSKLRQDRSPMAAAVWRLQVGGPRTKDKG